jgi:hypothetical protein
MYSLTEYEKHESKTDYQLSFMIKLLISQFVTQSIMYYVISLLAPDLMWEASGLIPQMSNLIIVSAVMQTVFNFVNIGSIIQCVMNKCKFRGRSLCLCIRIG